MNITFSIFVVRLGEPGVGKSCSMAMLAIDWADDNDAAATSMSPSEGGLGRFDFVFLIELRTVDSDLSIEELIIRQHPRFKAMGVKPEEIRTILLESQVLLLLDGYDEYKKGTNVAIDNAIDNTIGNCFLVVTCRPGDYMDSDVRARMDGEIQITGLSGK